MTNMTNQEAIHIIENVNANNNCINCFYKYDVTCEDCRVNTALDKAIEALENQKSVIEELEKIITEIKEKIEQEEFARSVFRHEEKDTVKAEQCTGSIMAYKNVIILFDKYKAESEELKEE